MFETTLLDLAECRAALAAMLLAAQGLVRQPLAFAVVNDYGELMAFARMDGATPAVRELAIKKAYTSARMRADLKDFRAGLEQRGRNVTDYADPDLVGMAAGGIVIRDQESSVVLGGIGVSGGTPDEDEKIARAGLLAFQTAGDRPT
ncbi:MAG TPA: heme-binding protein [Dehalococcoidia bacterium]|nr:heme-binding protein [Dehalococcoidia bacterium]